MDPLVLAFIYWTGIILPIIAVLLHEQDYDEQVLIALSIVSHHSRDKCAVPHFRCGDRNKRKRRRINSVHFDVYKQFVQSPDLCSALYSLTGFTLHTFNQLHLLLQTALLQRKRAHGGISSQNRLLLLLFQMRHNLSQDVLGYIFGFDKSSVNRIIRDTGVRLFNCSELKDQVRWPSADTLAALHGLIPGVEDAVGVLDATTVRVNMPRYSQQAYYRGGERYGGYYLVFQIVVTVTGHIISVFGGGRGARHDVYLFDMSNISTRLGNNELLLADSAYSGRSKVIAKLTRAIADRMEINEQDRVLFNRILSRSRVKVEHCIGRLKNRWSAIGEINRFRDLNHIVRVFYIACYLHNWEIMNSHFSGDQ
jgi:hypothetical protein